MSVRSSDLSRCSRTSAYVLALLLLACGSGSSADAIRPVGAAAPAFIPFPEGRPASAYWNDATDELFVADNENNQIWKWTDAGGLVRVATTPDPGGELAGGASNVGQIVQLADGTLVVARFGQPGGGFGALAWVRPDGTSGLVPGLDEKRKRLGLAAAPDRTIYGAYFAHGGAGRGVAGAITRIDLQTGETVVAEGFGKLIGLVAKGETLYVSDQSAGTIYSAPLGALPAKASEWTVFAKLPVPDQICEGPDGSLFSGQFGAAPGSTDPLAIRQIRADGTVTRFASDPDVSKPSGLAYDPGSRRLFAADTGNVAHIGVHVFPVP